MNSITVTNNLGLGKIRIKRNDLGDYLYGDSVHSISWYDCQGSVCRFVGLIKEPKNLKNHILSNLRASLNNGKKVELNDIEDDFKHFLKVFTNGDFTISIYELEKQTSSKYDSLDYVFPSIIDKKNEQTEQILWNTLFKNRLQEIGYIAGDILNFTTINFYDGWTNLIATQAKSNLDKEKIAEYESMINNGLKPYCLIYNCYYKNIDEESNNYILDGHHKLIAYKNLKIKPNIIEITQIVSESSDFEFDELDIKDSLFDWQLKHIFENGFSDDNSISRIYKDDDHPFKKFIKNGFVKEYWINGKIKLEGNYKNNKADGIVKIYFETGQIQSEILYKKGKLFRHLKSWRRDGQLESEYIPYPDYENGLHISYHDNGKVQMEGIYENGKILKRKYFDRLGNSIER